MCRDLWFIVGTITGQMSLIFFFRSFFFRFSGVDQSVAVALHAVKGDHAYQIDLDAIQVQTGSDTDPLDAVTPKPAKSPRRAAKKKDAKTPKMKAEKPPSANKRRSNARKPSETSTGQSDKNVTQLQESQSKGSDRSMGMDQLDEAASGNGPLGKPTERKHARKSNKMPLPDAQSDGGTKKPRKSGSAKKEPKIKVEKEPKPSTKIKIEPNDSTISKKSRAIKTEIKEETPRRRSPRELKKKSFSTAASRTDGNDNDIERAPVDEQFGRCAPFTRETVPSTKVFDKFFFSSKNVQRSSTHWPT